MDIELTLTDDADDNYARMARAVHRIARAGGGTLWIGPGNIAIPAAGVFPAGVNVVFAPSLSPVRPEWFGAPGTADV